MTDSVRRITHPLERLAAALAGGTLLLGLSAIAGWYGHSPLLVQWQAGTPPMPFNTALGMSLTGGVLLFLLWRQALWVRILGGLVFALGLMNYLQFVFQQNFGIDQLFHQQDMLVNRLYPGRISPGTSLAFILAGGATLVAVSTLQRAWQVLLMWLAGGALVMLAALLGLGYLVGWIQAVDWNRGIGVSIPSALGVALVGGTVLLLAQRATRVELPPATGATPPETAGALRAPVGLGLGFFLLTLLLWRGWAMHEYSLMHDASGVAGRIAQEAIVRNWNTDLQQMAALARQTPANLNLPAWKRDAQQYLERSPTLEALVLTDADAQVLATVPTDLGRFLDNKNLAFEQNRRTALERARTSGQPTLSPTVQLLTGGLGVVAFVPVLDSTGQVGGFIEGVYRVDRMLTRTLPAEVLAENNVTVEEQERQIYSNSPGTMLDPTLLHAAALNLSGVDWRLRLEPTLEHQARLRSPIPEILLLTGLATSVLLALVWHFARRSRAHGRALEAVNRHLHAEAVARELAAESFRAQSELLAKIFENLADAVIVLNSENQITTMNPAAMALFGDQMTPTHDLAGRTADLRQEDGHTRLSPAESPSTRLLRGEAINHQVLFLQNALHPEGVYLAISGRPLVDAHGTIVGAVLVGTDISEQRRRAAELQQQNQLLERRVAERTQDLKRSNEELEQFAYVASHDLQEPLRVVSSYLELLERRYHDQLDQDAREFIDFAVTSAGRMKVMINDLLQFSRLNRASPTRAMIDLQAVATQAIGQLQAQIAETGATVECRGLPQVIGDGVKLTQLFQNLIANGIKFHGADAPRVTIEHRRVADGWEIAVRDNGIGFEPQYAEKIFVIFKRLHGPATYPGSGIGLAVCKKIVEQHGGRIWTESTPGRGSTFYFTLPQQLKEPPV